MSDLQKLVRLHSESSETATVVMITSNDFDVYAALRMTLPTNVVEEIFNTFMLRTIKLSTNIEQLTK